MLTGSIPLTSFAQVSADEVISQEQIVHKMVDGVMTVQKETVSATFSPKPPQISSFQSQSISSFAQIQENSYAKLSDSLNEKIDSGEEIVPVDILLENIPKWPNGWPDKTSYPTKEQIAQRSEEKASEAQTMQEPVIAFLEDNNVEITKIRHNLNTIHADVPVSLLSELENFDEIINLDTSDKQITSFVAEAKSFTGVEQLKFWGYDGSNTTVAIIDTGIDIVDGSYNSNSQTATVSHDDLNDLDDISTNNDPKAIIVTDRYLGDGNDDPNDCHGHGTWVSGVVSGTGEQIDAYSGYAPKSNLDIYKTSIDCSGNHDIQAVINTIDLAVQNGADVINLSLGGSTFTPNGRSALSRAVDTAFDNGVAVVVSSGNEPFPSQPASSGSVGFPGDAHKALTVGSVSGIDGTTWVNYSQWGPTSDGRIKPELVAPVDPLTTAGLDNSYVTGLTGTSFAAPQVSGTIASIHEFYTGSNITVEPGRMYAVMLSQATGDAIGSNGIHMDNQVGAGTLGTRHNAIETHSGFVNFEYPGTLTVPITVPANAEILTAALWWGEPINIHHDADLHLEQGSTTVASSTSSLPVTERIRLENPAPGTGAYNLVIDGDDIDTPGQNDGQVVWYSYTFTLPNTVPTANSENVTVGTGFTEITLTGSDIDREQLIFTIEDQPDHHFSPNPLLVTPVSTTTSTVTYAPTSGFTGADSFTFRVSDGLDNSSLATVFITVDPSLTTTEILNATIDYVNDEIQIQFDTKIDTDFTPADFDLVATLDDNSTQPLTISDVDTLPVASAFRTLEISGELPSNMIHLFIDVLNTNITDENGTAISDVIPFDEDVDPENTGGGGGGTNTRPHADAGINQQVNSGDLVTLDGSGSSDPDGDSLTYSWLQTDSSGHVVDISDNTAISPTFTAPTVAAYTQLTFELTVTEQTPEALSDDNSVSIFVAPLSQSRDPDSFIPHPSPSSFSRFGEIAETSGDRILTSTGSATFVSAVSTSTQELISANVLESNLQSLSTNPDILLQPIDLEIIDDGNTLQAVLDDGTTYSITETVVLDGTESFDTIISTYNSGLTSQSEPNSELIALIDEDNNRVYLVDPVTSQALAFSFYWGFAYLYDFNSSTPLTTTQGPGSTSSDYAEDDLVLFDQNSLAVSDTRFQYTDPNAFASGLVHVYDNVSSGLVTDPDYFVENPERASSDRFGSQMTNVGSDKILVSGSSMTNIYLFSKDGTTQINSYPNPVSSSNFSPSSMESFGSDKFIVGYSNKVYVFSESSPNPTLVIDAPAGSSGFGNSVATNSDKDWILVGAPTTTVDSISSSGLVYLFDGTTGALIHTIANPEPGPSDQFGKSVSFIKNKIIVGAPDDDPSGISNAGSAYLFSPVDGSLLESIHSDRANENFGFFVSEVNSGNSIVVSAPEYDGTFTDEGRIFIYSNLNNIPIANADVNPSQVESGNLVTLDGSGSSDPDGDSLTYSWLQTDSSGHVVDISDNTAISPTFTAPSVTSDTTLSFELTVNDGIVDSVVSTVNVLVVVGNSIPVAGDDTTTVNESESVNIDVVSNDVDSDGTLDLASINILFSPAHGIAIANVDGTITYTHDGSENTVDTFTYTINDNQGDSSNIATVSVNIIPVNDPPILNPIGNHVIDEQTLLTFTATSTDPDIPVQLLTFSLTNFPPTGATIDSSTGVFSWTPSFSQVGIHVFDITVSDGVVSISETIVVTVNNVNDAPIITLISPLDNSIFLLDELIDFTGTATDVEDGDLTSVISWTSSKDGLFGTGGSLIHSNLSEGTHVITASISDSQGAGSIDSITISIQSDPNLELYCNDLTIVELEALAAEGQFHLIDNRGGVSTLLRGTNGADLIFAGEFGDTIKSRNGDDCVIGGSGDDDIRGGNGNDQIFGENGNDQIFGEGGDDNLRGNKGNDLINGGNGNDVIHAGRGNDNIVGGEGNDRLHGHLGNDELDGGSGDDDLRGGKGNDVLNAGDGNDTVRGHRGNDLINGGNGDDELRGGKNNDTIIGGNGADTIRGGNGNDTVEAGEGDDDVRGNRGNDKLLGQVGDDTIHGGKGNDTIIGGNGIDMCHGGQGNDTVDCENMIRMQEDNESYENEQDDLGENDEDW